MKKDEELKNQRYVDVKKMIILIPRAPQCQFYNSIKGGKFRDQFIVDHHMAIQVRGVFSSHDKGRMTTGGRLSSENIGFNPMELQRLLVCSSSHLLVPDWTKGPP